MEDLAMYIIEILMNSIHASSNNIICNIEIDTSEDLLTIIVEDDGKGMEQEFLNNITNPFVTTRKTRKIGLGVSFLQSLCDQCNGKLIIKSRPNIGTITIATLPYSHWDIPPLGNIGEMMMLCIQANPDIDFVLYYKKDKINFLFETKEIKKILDEVKIDEPDILLWIKDYINQGIKGENQ